MVGMIQTQAGHDSWLYSALYYWTEKVLRVETNSQRAGTIQLFHQEKHVWNQDFKCHVQFLKISCSYSANKWKVSTWKRYNEDKKEIFAENTSFLSSNKVSQSLTEDSEPPCDSSL